MNKRKFNDLHPISEVVSLLFKNTPLKKAMSIKNMAAIWTKTVPQKFHLHADVSDFKENTLYINVDNPVWSMELKFIEREIIQKINEQCGKNTLISIVYRIRTISVSR